ncbi:MAG: helix-turn-helix transcriptional regulator [Pseudoflavonifractor sp.]
MSNLYDTILSLCNNRGITGYRLCKDIGATPSIMTDLKMGRKKGLGAENADKIATYFGVSVGYLLGTEQKEMPTPVSESGHSDDEFVRLWTSLTPGEILRVKDFVQGMLENRKEQPSQKE